jgi:hypothetical protein
LAQLYCIEDTTVQVWVFALCGAVQAWWGAWYTRCMHTYEQLPRDDRSESFRYISQMMVNLAEHQGVHVDEDTAQRWSDLLGLLREFDTLVDDTDITHEEALQRLADFDDFTGRYPHVSPDSLGEETCQRMVRRVAEILRIGREYSTVQDPEEFIALRIEEVEHTAELLADCASGDTTTQPGFYTKFMPLMRGMGRTANMVDSLLDMRQDVRQEKIQIQPSAKLVMGLGKAALHDMLQVGPQVAYLDVWSRFAIMGLVRVGNRLRQGNQPYSSLRNISLK